MSCYKRSWTIVDIIVMSCYKGEVHGQVDIIVMSCFKREIHGQ
jgi:hypothetical protein